MKIWVWSDPHFGHQNIINYEARPSNFEELIINNYNNVVGEDDLSICLGDVFFSSKSFDLVSELKGRKVLVIGNHDTKSYKWYIDHGFDFACDQFSWHLYTWSILFTHVPVTGDMPYTYNVHGHLHANDHHGTPLTNKNVLYAPEKEHYTPIQLKTLLDKHIKSMV